MSKTHLQQRCEYIYHKGEITFSLFVVGNVKEIDEMLEQKDTRLVQTKKNIMQP